MPFERIEQCQHCEHWQRGEHPKKQCRNPKSRYCRKQTQANDGCKLMTHKNKKLQEKLHGKVNTTL